MHKSFLFVQLFVSCFLYVKPPEQTIYRVRPAGRGEKEGHSRNLAKVE